MRKILALTLLSATLVPAYAQTEKAVPEIRKPAAGAKPDPSPFGNNRRGQRDGERGSAAAGGSGASKDEGAEERRAIDPRTGQTPVEAKPAEKPQPR